MIHEQPKILLDECVTIRLGGQKKIIDTSTFHCSKNLVGVGASDGQVMQFAKENAYMVVTADKGLIIRCMKNNVPVAWYHNDKAHVLAVAQTFEIPYETTGAPFKPKKIKQKRKPSLIARIKNTLSSKYLPL